jgi:hypothetical protein
MGLYDHVRADREEFKCSEGHDLGGVEFQTKDLGETMGEWALGETLSGQDGGYNEPPPRPFSGRISIYASCEECPAFVQADTLNLCACWVEFEVEIVEDRVRKVARTSPTTAEWLKSEPAEPWMAGCRGPMPYPEAYELHISGLRKVFGRAP